VKETFSEFEKLYTYFNAVAIGFAKTGENFYLYKNYETFGRRFGGE
jgi:hypothetical protein